MNKIEPFVYGGTAEETIRGWALHFKSPPGVKRTWNGVVPTEKGPTGDEAVKTHDEYWQRNHIVCERCPIHKRTGKIRCLKTMIDLEGIGRIGTVLYEGKPEKKPGWRQALEGTVCVPYLTDK